MSKKISVKVKKLNPNAIIPKYATQGSGCFDIHSLTGGCVKPGYPLSCDTGLAFDIPVNHVMLVFSRSGHGFKNDVRLANCVGVIDSDYRGALGVKLTPDSVHGELTVAVGDRIAQAMVIPIDMVDFEEVDELSSTDRGAGGFGSTGK